MITGSVNVAATHFGIALPKWIVEKQNSIWVCRLLFFLYFAICHFEKIWIIY